MNNSAALVSTDFLRFKIHLGPFVLIELRSGFFEQFIEAFMLNLVSPLFADNFNEMADNPLFLLTFRAIFPTLFPEKELFVTTTPSLHKFTCLIMYTSYYNLSEKPFQISTDPSFLWLGEKHKEALAILKYGVMDEKGFVLLTGEAGTGKTTLINALLESLDGETLVANITDPDLDLMGFLNLIAISFGVSQKFDKKEEFIVSFKEFLTKTHFDNKRALLIIDEAHRLSKKLLEQSRLISNIELPEKKLINIFFVGQNELNQRLLSRDCHALRQRITLNYQIQPLSESETLQYIHHRLKVAGNDKELFNREAISEIYRFSNGYPRLTNLICDHALITGYIREVKTITPDIIRECSQDVLLPGEVMEDSLSNSQKQPTADGLPHYLRPPPAKKESVKRMFLEGAKTLVRALKQGVRRNAGRFSWEEAKKKYIILDLPTRVHRRPYFMESLLFP